MNTPVGFLGYNIGGQELLIVLAIILLLFGAKKLPDLARSLGRSLGEFKKGRAEGAKQDAPTPPSAEDGKKRT